jgi:selenocysteine lyase/cysteine desulfurase
MLQPTGNPGRSSHGAGIQADRILFELREALAELFRLEDSSRIVLTSGATESLNTVLKGVLKPGMKVLTSSLEHNAVMRPLNQLARERMVGVSRFACLPETGRPDMSDLQKRLGERPDLLVLTAASNVCGSIFPLEEIASLARKRGVPVCVDAAQGGGETELYPEKWGIDYLCFAGHKGLLGPAGTGGFYIRDPETLPPLITGGTGSRSREEEQPVHMPDRFESGTPNIPGLAGLLHSLTFLAESGKLKGEADQRFERFLSSLRECGGVTIVGRPENARAKDYTRVLSILPEQGSLTELTAHMDRRNIALRSGLHCAPAAHRSLGTFRLGGTLRVSPGLFSSDDDLDMFREALGDFLSGRPRA